MSADDERGVDVEPVAMIKAELFREGKFSSQIILQDDFVLVPFVIRFSADVLFIATKIIIIIIIIIMIIIVANILFLQCHTS